MNTETIGGRMYDLGLGYGISFYVTAAWCIGGALLLAMLRRPRRGGMGRLATGTALDP